LPKGKTKFVVDFKYEIVGLIGALNLGKLIAAGLTRIFSYSAADAKLIVSGVVRSWPGRVGTVGEAAG
jgi:hypothetical protein